jgi:hypothetical protein
MVPLVEQCYNDRCTKHDTFPAMTQVPDTREPVTWDGRLAEPWSAAPRRPLLELLGPALADHVDPVIVFDDGAAFTGPELLDRIERFAGVLTSRMTVGERVLLACGNRAILVGTRERTCE